LPVTGQSGEWKNHSANKLKGNMSNIAEPEKSHSEQQAIAQLESIVEMIANCTREGSAHNYVKELDKDQLLKMFRGGDIEQNVGWNEDDDVETLREAMAQYIVDETITPDDFEFDEDSARQTIQEDPLFCSGAVRLA
jgi:hypothetical protein